MKPFLTRWLMTTLAVMAAVWLTPVDCSDWYSLFAAALLLGIINAFIRPVIVLLSLPFILVSLGFFILVINALMLWTVSGLVQGFVVPGFWSAFFGAIIISLVSWVLSALFRDSEGHVHILTHHAQIKQAHARTVE